VTVVNVFASWCLPCHEEHPFLMELARDSRIRIAGINQKDQPDNARRFLGRNGNPYHLIGVDPAGRTVIDWGVYGVPETFIVERDGRIAFKHVGPITAEVLAGSIRPALEAALGR
jgi:cytochrome c biogenesis protein CcmG, thiol:disulfide interchange protein DsbE